MGSASLNSAETRLQRCIRDLAALNALPALCVGRSPAEVVELVIDMLPTALSADLILLTLPGDVGGERAWLGGRALSSAEASALKVARVANEDTGTLLLPGGGKLWYFEAELAVRGQRGALLAGRTAPLDPDTDRVLVRSAANLVGTTLETAAVLDAARRKDEFLAVLGHELRSPLAPILTAVELLARHPAAAREQNVIERHTQHLARLVDDLLDISRVTRGQLELRSEPVSVASILERGIELAAPSIQRLRHTLEVGDAGRAAVQGDPVRLAQVFGNLLNNAAKFTPAKGKIAISVRSSDARVAVTIRDSGRGISGDVLHHIFEPFVQADPDEQHGRRGGLGLGLAIVRDLVTRHGGTVTATSEGLNQGAAFTVELPAVTLPEPMPAAVEVAQTRVRSDLRVLIVDDNVDVAELLSEALELAGCKTAVAFDAPAALETWRHFRPHAAVLDLGLPEVDGFELVKSLRREYGPSPTLIAATGHGRAQDRSRARQAGFDGYLLKPFRVKALLQVLERHDDSA